MEENESLKAGVVLECYKMQVGRSEHFETQLLSVVRLHFTLVAVLLAVAGFDKSIVGTDDLLVGIAISFVGLMGLACVRTYSYRALRHGRTARQFRMRLDQIHELDFDSARDAGKVEAKKELGISFEPSVRRVWRTSYYAVILLGLALTVAAAVAKFQ